VHIFGDEHRRAMSAVRSDRCSHEFQGFKRACTCQNVRKGLAGKAREMYVHLIRSISAVSAEDLTFLVWLRLET
jgi:hypothetical protein